MAGEPGGTENSVNTNLHTQYEHNSPCPSADNLPVPMKEDYFNHGKP